MEALSTVLSKNTSYRPGIALRWLERVTYEERTVEAMSDGESDDGKRVSKKRKASRACDRCNSQHQPCDNASPKCSVCERAGTECTYNRPVRKRGPRSGYTGQNGERLWSIVLQARPDLEDVVLQILRSGTYGNTGISNYEYFKNNDNQAGLVSWFNESRVGKYLEQGESADLMLPPIDEHSSAISPQAHREITPKSQSSNTAPQFDASRSVATTASALLPPTPAAISSIVNPHGAPQNPSDIYLPSEDIKKHLSHVDQVGRRGYIASSPQTDIQGSTFQSSLAAHSINRSSPFEHGTANGYDSLLHQQIHRDISLNRRSGSEVSTETSSQGEQHRRSTSRPPQQGSFGFDADAFHWFDSAPTDTLLNLGFVPGEGMEQDFLELCENPEPIEPTPTGSIHQDEDEEVVWRRLVMRGRFV
ncbi:hypothetical protein DL764_002964 [Monosporascus ibericus]|uniref:Zn(2)-C6 fungal-type domain-containing protein n=1 Tax=Monosporascus ibericus TaxID=155417 RepID=A0A4Q4TLQ8_9PEZI|nr:hypothetical protein DL764_002964 [Monosporascus ibericus]